MWLWCSAGVPTLRVPPPYVTERAEPPPQSIRVCSPLLQQHKVGRGTRPAPLPTAGAMLGSWGCGVASIVGCHGGGGLWGSWGGRGMRAMEVPCRGVCWGLCSAAGPCLGCCLST